MILSVKWAKKGGCVIFDIVENYTPYYRKLHTLFQIKILPLRKICENKQTIICKLPLNIEEVSIIQEIILGIDIEVIFGL